MITIFALLGAFVVMMAALAYNPHKTNDFLAHVYGQVTDGQGAPIPEITIFFNGLTFTTVSDEKGKYSVELDRGQFDLGVVHCQASNDRFTQFSDVYVVNENEEILLNFILVNDTDIVIPAGPIVLVTTPSGLTQTDISTCLENVNRARLGSITFYPGSGSEYRNMTFSASSTNGSLTYHGLDAYFRGKYTNTPGPECYVEWTLGMNGPNLTSYELGNMTLDQDYLNRSEVAFQSTFYSLTLGESLKITASPKDNVTLPEALWPKFPEAFSESRILSDIDCTYRYSFYDYSTGKTVIGDNSTIASVKLTPLTPGIHHYQVYIEQDYIIHVWELPNNSN